MRASARLPGIVVAPPLEAAGRSSIRIFVAGGSPGCSMPPTSAIHHIADVEPSTPDIGSGRVERIGCPAGFRTEAASKMVVLRQRRRHKSAGFARREPRWRAAARTRM
jgi:hypothetical protein